MVLFSYNSPTFSGICGTGFYLESMPKRTFQPNNRKKQKKHGFRARMKSATGQNVLKRRRQKGRARLSH